MFGVQKLSSQYGSVGYGELKSLSPNLNTYGTQLWNPENGDNGPHALLVVHLMSSMSAALKRLLR